MAGITKDAIPDSLLPLLHRGPSRAKISLSNTMATTRRRSKRARLVGPEAASSGPPPLPLPTEQSSLLDSDVSGHILSFLDPDSFLAASAVSRAFRDAIIPRQRNVSIAGFHSYESMKSMNFSGAVYFSGGDSDLVINDVLKDLAGSFPSLKSVDINACRNINVNGVRSLVKAMGSRLETFIMHHDNEDYYRRKKDIRTTDALIQVLATAPALESLSLVIPTNCKNNSLQPLDGMSSLRKLRLLFAGVHPVRLPPNLSQLDALWIRTDTSSGFRWTELGQVKYPNLQCLVVSDRMVNYFTKCPREHRLSAELLIAIMSQAPRMKKLFLLHTTYASKLKREKRAQEELLRTYMTSRGIENVRASMSS